MTSAVFCRLLYCRDGSAGCTPGTSWWLIDLLMDRSTGWLIDFQDSIGKEGKSDERIRSQWVTKYLGNGEELHCFHVNWEWDSSVVVDTQNSFSSEFELQVQVFFGLGLFVLYRAGNN